ncbi:hypothetical protein EV195_101713 [Tenacibaculum skagerrakense]|uniref:Uncharacterized protein n=1 Tax=Tenacibaculum skagerrakense TaxID=186571 RepID=A0A4R2P3E3_9FLAO|nr:hypothetical protein [Tenacibaculum skagerrakense]TCP28534.1 hypothetical protein EV195_101713 [Tenacibaculum skagerrakense]
MSKKFIELKLGSHQIVHAFDEQNKEIIEEVTVDQFSKKLVNLSRIKSVSEKYILTDYAHGRWIYWEYEGDFETIKKLVLQ